MQEWSADKLQRTGQVKLCHIYLNIKYAVTVHTTSTIICTHYLLTTNEIIFDHKFT